MEEKGKPFKGDVREKKRRKDFIRRELKLIEHRLKAQDMLNKRSVLFTAPTERMNKIYFWDGVLAIIVALIVVPIVIIYIASYIDDMIEASKNSPFKLINPYTFLLLPGILIFMLVLIYIQAIESAIRLYEGYRAYKKLKEEEKKLEEEKEEEEKELEE